MHQLLTTLRRRRPLPRVLSSWRAVTGWRPAAPAAVAEPAQWLGPEGQWRMVANVIVRDLGRLDTIAAAQANAALKIDAAEHALGRIAADCAHFLATSGTPPRLPRAPRPVLLPEQIRPLAA